MGDKSVIYIHTTSTEPAELEAYLAAVNTLIKGVANTSPVFSVGVNSGGVEQIHGTVDGKFAPNNQGTQTYAEIMKKQGADGYYIVSAQHFMDNWEYKEQHVFSENVRAMCPSHRDFNGLQETDDISQWIDNRDTL